MLSLQLTVLGSCERLGGINEHARQSTQQLHSPITYEHTATYSATKLTLFPETKCKFYLKLREKRYTGA